MTIWFDVEDLLEYARLMPRPSGIQRLSFELHAAAQAQTGGKVGFVRHDPPNGTMRVVAWDEIRVVYGRMARGAPTVAHGSVQTGTSAPLPLLHSRLARTPILGGALQLAAERLPSEIRQPLGEAARAQWTAFRGLARAAMATPALLARRRARTGFPSPGSTAAAMPDATAAVSAGVPGQDLRDAAQPGDTIAALGSPWTHPDYARLVTRMASARDLRFALLIYDMIPALRPEYCDPGLVALFSGFVRRCLPATDRILAISEATVRDVQHWAARSGIALRDTPRAIPIGTGFSHAAGGRLPFVPGPAGYALFVSTIEARKNHTLAFRAWRRLLGEMPAEEVPMLVFAGRVGWMVGDLMQQISNARQLDGKLLLVENPDDATLAALYQGARFTLFPSLYEGWGLPVSESLAFGKVCIASGSSSIPEAGGSFCLYHDPDCVSEALSLYRRAIKEPELIRGLEERIAREYAPRPWSDTAAALLRLLG